MSRHSNRYIRTAADEATREPQGWMSLKQVADHFGVSQTTIRLGRGEFAALRKAYVGGSVSVDGEVKGARVLFVREDVMSLSKRMEREAMCLTETCATEKEDVRAYNEEYRRRISAA